MGCEPAIIICMSPPSVVKKLKHRLPCGLNCVPCNVDIVLLIAAINQIIAIFVKVAVGLI